MCFKWLVRRCYLTYLALAQPDSTRPRRFSWDLAPYGGPGSIAIRPCLTLGLCMHCLILSTVSDYGVEAVGHERAGAPAGVGQALPCPRPEGRLVAACLATWHCLVWGARSYLRGGSSPVGLADDQARLRVGVYLAVIRHRPVQPDAEGVSWLQHPESNNPSSAVAVCGLVSPFTPCAARGGNSLVARTFLPRHYLPAPDPRADQLPAVSGPL